MENEKREHTLCLTERKRLCATCVKEVDGLSGEKILITLFNGERAALCGSGLKICAFSRQTGQLEVEGVINEVKYAGEKLSLLKKLIK